MPNAIVVLNILQQAYRIADVVILNELTPVLTTQRIGKRMGWHSQLTEDNNYLLFKEANFTFQIKNQHLNLAMCADPLFILKNIEKESNLAKINSIDLGLTYINDEELAQIVALLPNVKILNVSGNEEWIKSSANLLKTKNIELIVNPADYFSHYENGLVELNKFSSNCYRRHARLLTTFRNTKSIARLEFCYSRNIDLFTPSFFLFENLKSFIARLRQGELGSEELDEDVVDFGLAMKLEQGVMIYECTHANYYRCLLHKDLRLSLTYWNKLRNRGYAVDEHIQRVEDKISQKSDNNFTLLRNSIH